MKPRAALLLTLLPFSSLAHHGVAGVGAAALEGPGAPVESASSATLPEDRTLLYLKVDHAEFRSVDPTDTQADWSRFWMSGIGHGFTPWFSAYLFAPYNSKVDTAEPPAAINPAPTPKFDTHGWADLSLMGQIGFKHEPGQGLRLIPANESLDDLEDWHFTAFAGTGIPHGQANLRDRAGNIDPGKSTGFGKPSYSLGLTATKMLTPDLTLNMELSAIRFQTYTYADGNAVRFGDENRCNVSVNRRLWGDAATRSRLDGVLEAQYLSLGRDVTNAVGDLATGGDVVYLVPGLRLYRDNMSVAFGVKVPVATRLNEEKLQQGAEGKEKWRAIFSASILF
jgi:hypothetical protein